MANTKLKKNDVVSKMPISSTTMSPKGTIVFSLIFVLAGAYICAISLELIPFKGKIKAPTEIILAVGIIFLLAGLSVFVQGCQRLAVSNKIAAKKKNHLSSPWLWDYNWNPSGIRSRSQSSIVSHIIGSSIFSCVLFITYWIGFSSEIGFKIPFYLMSIFSLFILFWFYTMISKRIRYGRPVLKFRAFPLKLGEQIGIIFTGIPPRENVKEVIINIRFYQEGVYKGDNNQERISLTEKFCHTLTLPASAISTKNELEVNIELPQDISFANELSSSPASFWEAQIQCDIKGWDYREYYLLPIYK